MDSVRLPGFICLVLLLPTCVYSDWSSAISANDAEQLRLLLPEQQEIDRPIADGKTALMAAAAAGDYGLAKSLIAAGADSHKVNDRGGSALIYASWSGSMRVVELLLRSKVNIAQQASNGWTALTMAAAKGYSDIVRRLLATGAPVDTLDVYGWTPLMRATDRQHVNVVQLLVEQGKVNLGKINDRGQTALHIAATTGNPTIYRILKEGGCDPDRADFAGRSARHIAMMKGLKTDQPTN